MNHKQKLGYALLGAAVMAIGMTIGQFTTPNIEAQNNSVLDEIVCKKITVVDSDGNPGILLESKEKGNQITINHEQGKEAISLITESGGALIQLDKPSGEFAAALVNAGPATMLSLGDRADKPAISLQVLGEVIRSIEIADKKGTGIISLNHGVLGTDIIIENKAGERIWKAP